MTNIGPKRTVRFQEAPIVHILRDHVRREEREDIWFTRAYLDWAHEEDVQNNLLAQSFVKDCRFMDQECIEGKDLTWRGLEKILGKSSRKGGRVAHIQSVVKKAEKTSNPESLRSFAKASSKADRIRAVKVGEYDEAEASGKSPAKKKDFTSMLSFKERAGSTFSARRASREYTISWVLP